MDAWRPILLSWFVAFPLYASALSPHECEALLAGAPRLNYAFVGYRTMVNGGELRGHPRGERYYLEKRYLMNWDTTDLAQAEEHLAFLRFLPAEEVEPTLERDEQLVIEFYRGRRRFKADRIRWLRDVYRKLPKERLVHFKVQTPEGLTDEYVRLIDATIAPDASEAEYLKYQAAFERHLKFVPPEREESRRTGKTIGIVELSRGYRWGINEDSPPPGFADSLVEIATYLDQRYVSRGMEAVAYVHTDEVGAKKLFGPLGFRIVQTPQDLGVEDEYLLKQDARELMVQRTRVPLWNRLWSSPDRRHCAFEMYDPPRSIGALHPFLRPSIAMCPRYSTRWNESPSSYPPPLDEPDHILNTLSHAHILQAPLRHGWGDFYLKSRELSF